ncbi:MAG: alpha/beta hydrolase-fold protein [Gemmatimonadales bacterium]
MDEGGFTRRRFLLAAAAGVGVLAGAGAGVVELVDHGVLPGKSALDRLDGACSVDVPHLDVATVGPTVSGRFASARRHTDVGYSIAYPPGHGPGDALPLIVMLHGFGGDHRSAFAGMQPAQGLALRVDGRPLTPMAMVTVDGGGGYWNPHPGDDPMGMVLDELVPMCRDRGLGVPPHRIAAMGISMGGYGAILFAERFPEVFSAAAAISPAIWTTYAEARQANPGAYASAASFAACDAVTHAGRLSATPVRVASGDSDPFHPGVVAFARACPPNVEVVLSKGCHTGAFFTEQEVPSLAFLSRHLAAPA